MDCCAFHMELPQEPMSVRGGRVGSGSLSSSWGSSDLAALIVPEALQPPSAIGEVPVAGCLHLSSAVSHRGPCSSLHHCHSLSVAENKN